MILENKEDPLLLSSAVKEAGKTLRGTFSGGVSVPVTSVDKSWAKRDGGCLELEPATTL